MVAITVKPDPVDKEKIDREEGPLPDNATLAEKAKRWRLYQIAKLMREESKQ